MTGVALPPAMFDLDADGDMTPPIFEPTGHGSGLTPYGRHHGLGPGVFGGNCCDEALYAAIDSNGHRAWIYHLCPTVGPHEQHLCDRCEVTW